MQARLAQVVFVGAFVIALTGCARVTRVWTRPGTSQQQFMKDRYECMMQAREQVSQAYANAYGGAANSEGVVNCGIWSGCLGARGYVVDPNGELKAPPGMAVPCHR